MSDLTDLQQRFAAARAALAAERANHLRAKERLLKSRRSGKQLERVYDQQNPEREADKQRLDEAARSLTDELGARVRGKADAAAQLLALTAELGDLGKPEDLASELSDDYPILFFPLRLETRFKKVVGSRGASQPDELWVRVYPDDCQIETFSDLMSESEVGDMQAYWSASWVAGGIEADERGAWRKLVNGHGSGRSAWLVAHYVPANAADKPAKLDQTDFFLVIDDEPTLTEAEKALVPEAARHLTSGEEAAAKTFWRAVWLAGDDVAARSAARVTLATTLASADRAAYVERHFAPRNLADLPPAGTARTALRVAVFFLRFPAESASEPAATASWLQAPAVRTLPERLLILGFRGGATVLSATTTVVPPELHVGPDPSLPDSEQMKAVDGGLKLNAELRWLTDFEEAQQKGMARRIELSPEDARLGFDELVVVGLRFSSGPDDGARALEQLLTSHYRSRSGFSLLPQGTPTNNTEGSDSGHTSLDDAEVSFGVVFQGKSSFTETADPLEKADGQWLASGLGIRASVLQQVPNAGGRDQAEARAMNTALWPATWGYFLEEMMSSVLSGADVAITRAFFTNFVSGRGPLPALRVGRQPYGVLPTTVFSRLAFETKRDLAASYAAVNVSDRGSYFNRLHGVLSQLDAAWDGFKNAVPTVAKAGAGGSDPYQTLLDILGLHPTSVEFHQRFAQSFAQMYNELVLRFGEPWASLYAAVMQAERAQMLASAGLPAAATPPVLDKFFLERSSGLKGELVDDLPLSETRPVRPYTADQKNYLAWLAESSLESIRTEKFGGPKAPSSLLYLWLRHAMMLAYWDGGLKLYEDAGVLEPGSQRKEPDFIHIASDASSESKWRWLYSTSEAVTGSAGQTVAEYVSQGSVIAASPALAGVRAMRQALGALAKTPTARLERLFAEHVDCCQYRLDAWKGALVSYRLEQLRQRAPEGIYLGAYGFLANVRSENKRLEPVELSSELAAVFAKPNEPAPVRDDKNAGFIHAPSLGQATTAAVLKSAYLSAASPAAAETFSVDLTSVRVRKALHLLEGIRNGQSLAALLGYQFERGLHDKHALAEVDKFIYPLRKAFPLVADKLKSTVTDPGTPIETLEARNVLDGSKLASHVKTSGHSTYPFGLTGLPAATPDEAAAIAGEVASLLDSNDAVSDTALSESVYQLVMGNLDRAAAHTDALGAGGYPPEVAVVSTPRTGKALSQRVAIHFDAAAVVTASPEPGLPLTARAEAEAPVNYWLKGLLPASQAVGCRVSVTSHTGQAVAPLNVSWRDLGLQPLDLLLTATFDAEPTMNELNDRVWHCLKYVRNLHPLDEFSIEYMVPGVGMTHSFFQLGALLRSLRAVVLKGRYVAPAEMALSSEAKRPSGVLDVADLAARVAAARTKLANHVQTVDALAADNTGDIDGFAKKVADELLAIALFGVPQTSPAALFSELKSIFRSLTDKIRAVLERWEPRIQAYLDLQPAYGLATTDDERLELLAQMESAVSAELTLPRPDVVLPYQGQVAAKKAALDQLYADLEQRLGTNVANLQTFMAALLPDVQRIPAFDSVPFDQKERRNELTTETNRVAALRSTTQDKLRELSKDLTKRTAAATALIDAAATQTTEKERVESLLAARALVLGQEFPMLPKFTLAPELGAELALAFADSSVLLKYQRDTLTRRFPVDDWLYGAARVKEKLFHFENIVFLSEALATTSPSLTPLQLPYRADDRWLALEFPADYPLDAEKLMYTAHFATAFDATAPQCALVVEEWADVIPSKEETTGITFHYDQPNSEPPQAVLLMVPPRLTGAWQWEDIVGGIRETFDAAKKRAVEPAVLDASPYAQFLPATLMAATLYQVTIATNLAANNQVHGTSMTTP